MFRVHILKFIVGATAALMFTPGIVCSPSLVRAAYMGGLHETAGIGEIIGESQDASILFY